MHKNLHVIKKNTTEEKNQQAISKGKLKTYFHKSPKSTYVRPSTERQLLHSTLTFGNRNGKLIPGKEIGDFKHLIVHIDCIQ